MIEVTERTYVGRVFITPIPRGDVMGLLFREDGGPWQILFRFRYYDNADPWADDVKHWTRLQARDGTDAERERIWGGYMGTMGFVARTLGYRLDWDIVEVDALGVAPFFEACKGRPWFHAREAQAPGEGQA